MRLSKQEQKRCPHLNTGKVRICEAYSKGLKVPSKKEIFEYCEGRFHLCRTYQERTQFEEKNEGGR